jgi:uncharacterized protein
MKPKYSSEDFYDRQWEQRHFQGLLLQGQNILISAPRRVGKTELSYKLLDWAVSQGWRAAYGDVQHAKDEADFLNELVKMLTEAGVNPSALDQLKNAGAKLRNLLPSAKYAVGEQSLELKLQPEAKDAYREAEECLEQLLSSLKKPGTTLMLCLDELPIFLTKLSHETGGEARAAYALHWFRRLRRSPHLQHVRWLLCGSIGLDTYVEQRGLAGTINDLLPEKLGPFSDEIALEFLKHRARSGLEGVESFELPDDLARELVARVGWPLPYYLGLMVHEMRAIPPHLRSKNFPSLADVETAYASLISAEKKVQFMHWVSRLDLQFGKVAALAAHSILKACCEKPRGITKSKLRQLMILRQPQADAEVLERELVSMLGILQRDGYLDSDEGSRWTFRSFLLRDFWREHVVY